jgi:hypothetical protein
MSACSVEGVERVGVDDSRTGLSFGEDEARVDRCIHSLHRMILWIPVASELAGLGLSVDCLEREKG